METRRARMRPSCGSRCSRIAQVVHDEVDVKVRVIVGSIQPERREVHVPRRNRDGAERELARAAGGGGDRGHQDCEQQACGRASGADSHIGETMAAVIVLIAESQAAETPEHNMASISGQAHGEHMAEFVHQDGGENDGHPIDGEPGIALIASDQKNL